MDGRGPSDRCSLPVHGSGPVKRKSIVSEMDINL